jgi:signal transduction histidine kinase
MNLKVSKGNITRFIGSICETFNNLAQQYQIKLIFEPKSDLEVWFDADKIEKILYNLISNALKFTPDGGLFKLLSLVKINLVHTIILQLKIQDWAFLQMKSKKYSNLFIRPEYSKLENMKELALDYRW